MGQRSTADLDAVFEWQAARIRRRLTDAEARRTLWLSHHWPDQYRSRCIRVGRRHLCRRCTALYPLGLVVAALSAAGSPPWPVAWDPAAIWLLSIPATVAFVGEAVGAFAYSPRWQTAAMLVSAVAFGRALGYELVDRWSPEFWQPVAVFGGLWFLASVFAASTGGAFTPASGRGEHHC